MGANKETVMEPENKQNVFMSSRHQNPGALAPTVKAENFTWAAILGIVALALVGAALLLEWMDWQVISVG